MKMLRPGQTREYILEQDRKSDEPTIFVIHQLSWEQMAAVNKEAALSMDQAFKVNAIYAKAKQEQRELTDKEKQQVVAIAPMDTDMLHRLNKQHSKAVVSGLSAIKNMRDENNDPYDIKVKDFERYADRAVIRELGTEIIQFTALSETDSKN